MSSTSFN
ncbi:hypothetical protein EC902281_2109, partial [Escherichia coli 90.2281]